jgi:penicillin-binding protein 2
MNQPKQYDPFWIQDSARTPRVDLGSTELIHHEVLFEKDMNRMHGSSYFLGLAISSQRIKICFYLSMLIFIFLVSRAGWMQIVNGQKYAAMADNNRLRSEVIPARRGIIRDRTGAVLAENIPSFDVQMRWTDLPLVQGENDEWICETECREEVSAIARAIGLVSDQLYSALHTTGTNPDAWIDVAKDIPYERAIDLSIVIPQYSGVSLITTAKRKYTESSKTPSLSHILGYVGSISPEEYEQYSSIGYLQTDDIGKSGIEQTYESKIKGKTGEKKIEVDAFGRPKTIVGETASTDGSDVRLTIDLRLQEAAEVALQKQLDLSKVSRGSVIVMDVATGGILASVSLPAYDNNIFTGRVSSTHYASLLNDENKPLFPRAWAGLFPSGSVIKPLIASAALQEGVITPNTTVFSSGGINVGPWFFPDWKAGGHGTVTVRGAIAWSVNTFFYYIGGGYDSFRGLGITKLSDWMKKFGLGNKLGLDIVGEGSGHVPTEEWKLSTKGERWYIGDTYNLSIGQGDLLVTPLQIARVTATIANGGKMVVPHFVDTEMNTNASSLEIDASVLKTVREGMHDTVVYGSGRRMSSLPMSSAGKTGTAQWGTNKPNHAWYTGFAPYEHPEIAITVLIEEGVEGSSVAVPVAYDVLQEWWNIKNSSTSTIIK